MPLRASRTVVNGDDRPYQWNTFSPRIGLTWDIIGDGKTVAKLSASQYGDIMGVGWYNRPRLTAPAAKINYWWNDANADNKMTFNEMFWAYSSRQAVGKRYVPYRVYDDAGNLSDTALDMMTSAGELSRQRRLLSATILGLRLPQSQYSARLQARRHDLLPGQGRPILQPDPRAPADPGTGNPPRLLRLHQLHLQILRQGPDRFDLLPGGSHESSIPTTPVPRSSTRGLLPRAAGMSKRGRSPAATSSAARGRSSAATGSIRAAQPIPRATRPAGPITCPAPTIRPHPRSTA